MLDVKMLIEDPTFVKECVKKAEQFELDGNFNSDVNENSYDGCLPVDENFPYIPKGFKHFWKNKIYSAGLKIYTNRAAKLLDIKVEGKENLKKIKKSSMIITCNHVSKFDSFAVRKAVGTNIMYVASDYNNWDNPLGEIGRHTGYLPVSGKMSVMKKFNQAMEYYLEKKKKKILFYPEQAMWRDYKKPRPLKDGAFHYAIKHNVPVLPLFITFRPSGIVNDGVEFMYFDVYILEPIYPNSNLDKKANVEFMRKTNYELWKDCYEKTYGIPLEYTTKDKSKIKI